MELACKVVVIICAVAVILNATLFEWLHKRKLKRLSEGHLSKTKSQLDKERTYTTIT